MTAKKKITWHIETRKVSDLKEWKDNPTKHDEHGLNDLEQSVLKFGLPVPPCVQPDGLLIGGHGRKIVLTRLKIKEVQVSVPNRKLDDSEFKELNVRLNKNVSGLFHIEKLNELFSQEELYDIGFTESELFSSGGLGGDGDKDPVSSLKGGDIIEIGNHRLICKNAKAIKTLIELMQKEKAITFVGGVDTCESLIKATLEAKPDAVILVNGEKYKAQ